MIEYNISEHFSDVRHAWGATLGQQHFEPLFDILFREAARSGKENSPVIGELIVVNFNGIESCTASYLKATIVRLLRSGQLAATGYSGDPDDSDGPTPMDIYPMVANLTNEVAEELDEVFKRRGLPCLEAVEWCANNVTKAKLHGGLDRVLVSTLQMLIQQEAATASLLHEKYPAENINVTGWNNRLSDLHRVRLAKRTKQGRYWVYTPVVMEVING